MKLQTKVRFSPADRPIEYRDTVVLLGSCFAENIEKKLAYYKFRTLQNPIGILFHPIAIEKFITRVSLKTAYTAGDVFEARGSWHCFEAHSMLSTSSKSALVQNLNAALAHTRQEVQNASHIFVTLGTAWAYRHKKTDFLVANCHKVAQNEFVKVLLTATEIIESLKGLLKNLFILNPNAQVIFTVSPVRHLKDGFSENQRSKAHLITALHNVLDTTPYRGKTFYFESYEVFMDELRDYRFYEHDMVHPNKIGLDYIWEKFKKVWISETTYATMEAVEAVQKALQHRPFNSISPEHQRFEKSLQAKITYLQREYPFMVFED